MSQPYVNKRHARHFGWESVKPTIPEHVERFAAYYAKEPVWGSLHVVLDEPNYSDADVAFCIEVARSRGDAEGEALAEILMRMSKTQRSKIGREAEHLVQTRKMGWMA